MGIQSIKELFERSDTSGSKSTILKPLTWLLSIMISGILISLKLNAPKWIYIYFAIIVGFTILTFFIAYFYCLINDRDALRSEKYSIQKMAIEKGLFGDNLTGTFIETSESSNQLKGLNNSEIGGDDL